ncbi:unnamed protein product [Pleuronectes platessa]|uniref:Cytoplasmic dynein 1 intermediate chain 1 n=1 Tax=Pleuronectes platessa TaxID=8262 RepID=A0A9N7V6N9_PLEPL|nr:unnamed protein product [Pleuronectes platessa]
MRRRRRRRRQTPPPLLISILLLHLGMYRHAGKVEPTCAEDPAWRSVAGGCGDSFCCSSETASLPGDTPLSARVDQPPQDTMSDKSDLKAELERKKQRLAQIREEKKRKEEERKKKEVRKKSEIQQKAEVTPEDSDLDRKRRETEALLQSIGISPEPPLVPTPVSPAKSLSTPSETGSQDSVDGVATGRSEFSKNKSQAHIARTLQWDTDPSVLQLQADSELGRRMQKLGASKITQVDFLPKEVVAYCKETQTPLAAHLSEGLREKH